MIDWNPRYLYRKIFEDENEMESFLQEVCHSEWNKQQDAGRPFDEAVAERITLFPQHEKEIRAYWDRWPEMLGEAVAPMEDLQQYFVKKSPYQVYALTNWSHETMPFAKEKYAFLHDFEGIVVSGEEKCVKPDHKIYHILLDRFNLTPQETIFIDDSFPNVEAARQLGIHGIHYNNPDQIYAQLQQLAVTLPSSIS